MTTEEVGAGEAPESDADPARRSLVERLLITPDFAKLWTVQVVSATGDWLGFFAIVVAAARVGGGTPEAAVSIVITARVVPGLFLAPIAGVLVDRWNRKRVMMVCDLGRAGTLILLPFVDQLWQLVIASFVLELFTLLWSPAKEASVPHVVPHDRLTTANSMSLVAAYGTIPIASLIFFGLAQLEDRVSEWPGAENFRFDQEALAFYIDAMTFAFAAFLIWRIALPARSRAERKRSVQGRRIDLIGPLRELKEGWGVIFSDPIVRAVIVGLATGLIGGGMLIPLGPVFAEDVLGADPGEGFATLQIALGFGVAAGVIAVTVGQDKVHRARAFVLGVFGAGISLFLAASMTTMLAAALLVAFLGLFAGAIYVLGFTLLHETVDDEFRGRIFASLYTVVRLCLILALAVGPALAVVLNGLSEEWFDKTISILGVEIFIPGVRLTLWLAALIIMLAGVLAWYSVRGQLREESRRAESAEVDV
ncbi:MAG: MFS transporter [Acidimicrobiales bacterium]